MFDFANILLSGKCNARCPTCIGRQIDPRLNLDNLKEYPPRNLDRFIEMIRAENVRQVVVTGTNTDPQLYLYEERLLRDLRELLPAGTQISLHTNGRMAFRKMAVTNLYDRVTISLPSFEPTTYRKMMGVEGPINLYEIMSKIIINFKISCIVSDDNRSEINSYLAKCQNLGIRRVVLRKLYGEKRSWQELLYPEKRKPRGEKDNVEMLLELADGTCYRGNPVVTINHLQVTLWDFGATRSTSINLFSNGLISAKYLLAKTEPYTPHKADFSHHPREFELRQGLRWDRRQWE